MYIVYKIALCWSSHYYSKLYEVYFIWIGVHVSILKSYVAAAFDDPFAIITSDGATTEVQVWTGDSQWQPEYTTGWTHTQTSG